MAAAKGNNHGKQFSKEYQPNEKWTEKKALAVGNDLINWLRQKDEEGNDAGNIFFEEFLYLEKDYYVDLIRYLKNKFKSFSDLLSKAKKIQEIKLMKYGAADRLNAPITKFVLINKHNFTDRKEIKTDVNIKEVPTIKWVDSNGNT